MRALVAPFALTVLVPLASACSVLKPHADTTRYYVLTAGEPSAGAPASESGPSLGLGPVTLPRYLDRSELVSRPGPHQLQVQDRDRWGEPLSDGVVRVLRQDLLEALPGSRVIPQPSHEQVDLVLGLDVTRFEPIHMQPAFAELSIRWSLHAAEPRRLLVARETILREPIAGAAIPEDWVAALSRVLTRFAVVIAREVRAVRADGAGPR